MSKHIWSAGVQRTADEAMMDAQGGLKKAVDGL